MNIDIEERLIKSAKENLEALEADAVKDNRSNLLKRRASTLQLPGTDVTLKIAADVESDMIALANTPEDQELLEAARDYKTAVENKLLADRNVRWIGVIYTACYKRRYGGKLSDGTGVLRKSINLDEVINMGEPNERSIAEGEAEKKRALTMLNQRIGALDDIFRDVMATDESREYYRDSLVQAEAKLERLTEGKEKRSVAAKIDDLLDKISLKSDQLKVLAMEVRSRRKQYEAANEYLNGLEPQPGNIWITHTGRQLKAWEDAFEFDQFHESTDDAEIQKEARRRFYEIMMKQDEPVDPRDAVAVPAPEDD